VVSTRAERRGAQVQAQAEAVRRGVRARAFYPPLFCSGLSEQRVLRRFLVRLFMKYAMGVNILLYCAPELTGAGIVANKYATSAIGIVIVTRQHLEMSRIRNVPAPINSRI
jgi:hypothetical protein